MSCVPSQVEDASIAAVAPWSATLAVVLATEMASKRTKPATAKTTAILANQPITIPPPSDVGEPGGRMRAARMVCVSDVSGSRLRTRSGVARPDAQPAQQIGQLADVQGS